MSSRNVMTLPDSKITSKQKELNVPRDRMGASQKIMGTLQRKVRWPNSKNKKEKKLLKQLNEINSAGQAGISTVNSEISLNLSNTRNNSSSFSEGSSNHGSGAPNANAHANANALENYLTPEILKLATNNRSELLSRCQNTSVQQVENYLELDTTNQQFLSVPTYPWYSYKIKDFSINNLKLLLKLFESYRYPTFHFCNQNIGSGFLFKSSKFTSKSFSLIESKVARLAVSGASGGSSFSGRNGSDRQPNKHATLFNQVQQSIVESTRNKNTDQNLLALEDFYSRLCEISAKSVLVVLEQSSSVQNERSWNFTAKFGPNGTNSKQSFSNLSNSNFKGIKVKGVKVYSNKKFDKILKAFERSLRPFPNEKIKKIGSSNNRGEVQETEQQPGNMQVYTHSIGPGAAGSNLTLPHSSSGNHFMTSPNLTKTLNKKSNNFIENFQNLSDHSILNDIDTEYFKFLNTTLLTAKNLSEQLKEVHIHLALDTENDYSAVISSLINIFINPKNRTIEGLLETIHREFVLKGHSFKSRLNRENYEIAPIFLGFLDAVYQLSVFNPDKFEFNERFLESLAFHSYSRRFADFMFDNERERAKVGDFF